jgi:soluble lytic murein transglycosylase-like protein
VLLACSSASAASLIPHRCTHAGAPRLCAIHFKHARVNQYRRRMAQRPIAYHWIAEAHPARRDRILRYWARTLERTKTQWRQYEQSPIAIITRIFGSAASSAISVARCESHLDPQAHNASGAAGLFQLMPSHWEAQGYDPYDPVTNTRIARRIYNGTGWSAWVCQP